MLALLERFSGYTLETLMEADAELLRLVQIEALGADRRDRDQDDLHGLLASLGV